MLKGGPPSSGASVGTTADQQTGDGCMEATALLHPQQTVIWHPQHQLMRCGCSLLSWSLKEETSAAIKNEFVNVFYIRWLKQWCFPFEFDSAGLLHDVWRRGCIQVHPGGQEPEGDLTSPLNIWSLLWMKDGSSLKIQLQPHNQSKSPGWRRWLAASQNNKLFY